MMPVEDAHDDTRHDPVSDSCVAPSARRASSWRSPAPARAAGAAAATAGTVARASGLAVQGADAAGFLQRWLLLEPIRVPGQLTESAVQAAVKKEYFPNQLTVVPRDGDKVTVGDEPLAWHAVDTLAYNVNLFHFAYALNKPTSNVLFWAVTVVNAPREMPGRAAGDRLERRVGLVAQRRGGDRPLQRSSDRHRRRRVEAGDAEEGAERRSAPRSSTPAAPPTSARGFSTRTAIP